MGFSQKLAQKIKDAIEEQSHDDLMALLKQAKPDDTDRAQYERFLLYALKYGTPETVKVILDAGASPDGSGLAIQTLLEAESTEIKDWLDKLKLLMAYGASVEKIADLRMVLRRMAEREDGEYAWYVLGPHLIASKERLAEGWSEYLMEQLAYYRRGHFLSKLSQEIFYPVLDDPKEKKELLFNWVSRDSHVKTWFEPIRISYLAEISSRKREIELALDAILSMGLDVNVQDSYGNTPLHYACTNGIPQIVELLLQRGADPNIENLDGETPLFFLPPWAIDTLELLLKKGGNPNAKNKDGEPLLIKLLDRWLHDNDLRGYGGRERKEIEAGILALRLLLDFGADPREKGPDGESFLIRLLRKVETSGNNLPREEFYGLLKEALKRGANPNEPGEGGNYPLHYAVKTPEVVQILLEWGANPNVCNEKGETPAHLAALKGVASKVLPLLKEAGADLSARTNQDESIGLYYIKNYHNPDLGAIKALHKAGVDFKDEKILHHLAKEWWESHPTEEKTKGPIISFLVKDLGLSPDAKNERGDTPLHVACSGAKKTLAHLLIDLGAKPWEKNSDGKAPGDVLPHRPWERFPSWASKLGLLPLQNQEALLEILKSKGTGVPKKRIEAFIQGVFQDDPLATMSLAPLLLSLPPGNPARETFRKLFQQNTKNTKVENEGFEGVDL